MSDTRFVPTVAAKALLRRSRHGALATLQPHSGAPYCSLVSVAAQPDGSPLLLISRLALHTKNILADPRVSLMLNEGASDDPLQGSRIMISGTAIAATPGERDLLRGRYLRAHPSAEMFVDFADFDFYRIHIDGIHLVGGFGRIVDLKPFQVLTDLTGAENLLAAEAEAVDHMNADHADALSLYATGLLGAASADWRCTGIDPDGLDLAAGTVVLRLDFPRRIEAAAALRKILKELADAARASTFDRE